MAIYRKKSGKRLVNSIATEYKGIKFKSRLEKEMFTLLEKEGIPFKYEPESYVVFPSFFFSNKSYERQANGKGDFTNRGFKIVTSISYKPDFVGENFFIETKGRRTEDFNLRFKLFKRYVKENYPIETTIYMPQTLTECKEVVELIKRKK